jgi:hypothetical protein
MINSIIFAGGTDAPGFQLVFTSHGVKIVRVPGWEIDQMTEIKNVLGILQKAGALKTPGLAEKVAAPLAEIVQKQFGEHMKEGGVFVAM